IGGVLIGLFVANRQTIEIPPQIVVSVDDACATLPSYGQTVQNIPNQQEQPIPIEVEPVDDGSTLDMEVDSVDESAPVATMIPDAELSIESRESGEAGASTSSDDTTLGAVGDTMTLPDTGGGVGSGGEAPPAAPADERIRSETAATESESAVGFLGGDADEAETSLEESDAVDTDRADGESARDLNQQQIQPLRAGEIDDNADWDVYQEYRNNYFRQYSPFSVNDRDVTDRQIIRVVDENGLPVLGACVQVYHGTSLITQNRTFATGLTMFFPNLLDNTRYVDTFRVVISKNDVIEEATLDRNAIGDTLTVELSLTQQISSQLDVMFLLDATGSMSDEIQQLQENILAISDQIDSLPGNVDVRYGLVSYRDFGDEYVTQVYDFTANIDTFQRSLRQVVANGGGDTPEALNEGLNEALNTVAWRDENTVKLIFLVADAPPHLDYDNGLDYSLMMFDALANGIKIHPIASSGLQPDGEYILRQIGQVTMGQFIFLTYDGSNAGSAGDDRTDLEVGTAEDEQGVGDYSVAQLDELVLRLITDELAALRGE
ncbi:MAG: vWA domain-containing protein, partial [Anaerolineae bacterium]|nr:vWA domain-containing protein [Anaerolineae bacterium]